MILCIASAWGFCVFLYALKCVQCVFCVFCVFDYCVLGCCLCDIGCWGYERAERALLEIDVAGYFFRDRTICQGWG
ncbi:hypothetical protein QBC36DRAFT_30194 [Triangularia setosa]|uniref:Uncharacterized protein n=1 Tax=Triangularia setosa TaxID=2587417 RepID=A0AAN6WEY8_9PEZI|nr:hypothetical protein QBC36DRAFT_30194 [Podospora setosa]